jgi:hypothetical protein
MNKRMVRLVVYASLMSLIFWFTACSGGSSSDSGISGLTYSGETSPATISEDNADTLAGSALDAGSSSSSFSLTGLAALSGPDPEANGSDRPLLLGIARTLEDAAGNVDFAAASAPNAAAALQGENGSLSGSCGGSASYSISVDTNTGAFSGNFSFSGYCADGMTLNGSASFSGIVNTGTETLESFTFSFRSLTATSGTESVTMIGTIAISASGSTITMNMTIQNNTTGWMFKVVNYQMVVTDYGSYDEYSISGRFFDQDYGYVDLETTETIVVYSGDEYPSSGKLTLYGEYGTAGGRTSAVLTAINDTYCQVEVDGDGDGIYEVTSGDILWTEL